MDKSSIIADAIKYIQDLQKQVRDVQAEICSFHSKNNNEGSSNSSSLTSATADVDDNSGQSQDVKCHIPKTNPVALHVDISKIEKRAFLIRINCKKGPRVLVHLTKAIESVQILEVQSCNVTCFDGHIIMALIATSKEVQEDVLKHAIIDMAAKNGICRP